VLSTAHDLLRCTVNNFSTVFQTYQTCLSRSTIGQLVSRRSAINFGSRGRRGPTDEVIDRTTRNYSVFKHSLRRNVLSPSWNVSTFKGTFVKMKSTFVYSFFGLTAEVVFASTVGWVAGQEVITTGGTLKGSPSSRAGYSEVSQYVGIPFAEPPLGALRWLPAKKYLSNNTIDATKWVSDCQNSMKLNSNYI
jgi:hypothetical protein